MLFAYVKATVKSDKTKTKYKLKMLHTMQKRQLIYQYVRNRERQEGQKKKWMFFSWVCELGQLSKLNQQHRGSSPCADREEKSESSTLQCCRSACPTSVKPVYLHRLIEILSSCITYASCSSH